MNVIACAGQLANGKDVLADYLADALNEQCSNNWERGSFADAVKNVFEKCFNVDRAFIEKWKRNPEPPPGMLKNIRKCLQIIGEGFREMRDDIWIEIALRDESKNLIISDSRFINEAKAVKAKNGYMLLVYRPGFLNFDPCASEAEVRKLVLFCVQYLSEGEIPSYEELQVKYGSEVPEAIQYYDYFIVNDKDVDHFQNKIKENLVPIIKERYGC